MPNDTDKQIIRDFFAALSSGNMPRVRELLHADVAWTIIGDTPVSRTFRGIAEFETGLIGSVVQPASGSTSSSTPPPTPRITPRPAPIPFAWPSLACPGDSRICARCA